MKTNDIDDARDRRLRALPLPVQEVARSARTHRRARAAFLAQAGLAQAGRRWPWLERVGWFYGRAEPVMAASIVVLYLGWAVQTVVELTR